MLSGAELDAYWAALNTNIEGDASDSDSAVSSQGSNDISFQSRNTTNHSKVPFGLLLPVLLPQLDKDKAIQLTALFGKLKTNKISKDAFVRYIRSVVGDQMMNFFSEKQSPGDSQQGQAEQKSLQIPKTSRMPIHGKNPMPKQECGITPNQECKSHHLKLQKISSQHGMIAELPSDPTIRSQQVPFYMLLPVLLPQLDKDKAMQLTTQFGKFKNNEISKIAFVGHIRRIVGDRMMKLAVMKFNSQTGPEHQLSSARMPTY